MWVRRPKYILGLGPCPRRHSGPRMDQQWGRSKTLSFTSKLWLLRLREVGRGGVSPQLNEGGVRKWVLISRVTFQEVLLIRICTVNVWDKMGAKKYLRKGCYCHIECFVEKTPEQYCLGRPNSQRTYEGARWDKHLSGCLNDWQVESQDHSRGDI